MDPIHKILVANRGEIAVRIIRTCRELNIRSVALFSDADAAMPHVRMADEAFHIGPPPSRESYLRSEKIVEVAKKARVDAIHPGYGFLSENPDFAALLEKEGIRFIGPPSSAIRMMGDKTTARRTMMEAGVPVVPGTPGPVATVDDASDFSRKAGYPVLIKAAAGGGGKGMRVVAREADLDSALRGARSEALSAFGDDRVYIEKYLENPRHIEFQILADHHGNVIHLGERECSIQRRHQKVVEESPSVIVNDDLRSRMGKAAVDAASACGYTNAGTIEFLVDRSRNFYFLEMNTRLQVEHPVTELRTGLDLVAEQIRIAEGRSLPYKQSEVSFRGHALECRIYAEDPLNNYLPSTGTIVHLRPAQGPGVRDDRGVEEGGEISVYYDPMISKLATWGADRPAAIRRMIRALKEYEIVGVTTNIPLNLAVLQHARFNAGEFDTHFLAGSDPILIPDVLQEEEANAAAAVAAYLHHRKSLAGTRGAFAVSQSRNGVHSGEDSNWKRSRINGMRGSS